MKEMETKYNHKEVEKDKLGEREKYWIDVYGAQGMMNQKAGG